MSALAPRLLSGLTRPARRLLRALRASFHTRLAREELSTMDAVICLTVSFVAMLGPAGWVLAHNSSYRKE